MAEPIVLKAIIAWHKTVPDNIPFLLLAGTAEKMVAQKHPGELKINYIGVPCLPPLFFAAGTPDQVKESCKGPIDTAGKDGGFIMDASTGLDDGKYENVQAIFEATSGCGAYQGYFLSCPVIVY